MNIHIHDNDDISINQKSYIQEILREENIIKKKTSPSTVNFMKRDKESPSLSEDEKSIYRSRLMKMMFAANRTRPDILFQCIVLSTRIESATQEDMDHIIHLMQYLNYTSHYEIYFHSKGNIKLQAYVDASHCIYEDRKSQTAFGIFIDDISSAIAFRSVKQKTVANSSTEAEIIAVWESTLHIVLIKNIMIEMGLITSDDKAILFQDNDASRRLLSYKNIRTQGNAKFIDKKYFNMCEHVDNGDIVIVRKDTENMIVDFLTKPMTGSKSKDMIMKFMGVTSNQGSVLE